MRINLVPELPTDSANYEVLTEGIKTVKNIKGMTCEIGLRRGGGTKHIIDALVESGQKDKVHIAIDPYGNIEYADGNERIIRCDYTNKMRDECMVELYLYCLQMGISFIFFNLEDIEFFKRFADGVPVYQEVKTIQNEYSFVHFDGPHEKEILKTEIQFFHERTPVGAVFVFDDVALYDHEAHIHPVLKDLGWTLFLATDRKWAYRKN